MDIITGSTSSSASSSRTISPPPPLSPDPASRRFPPSNSPSPSTVSSSGSASPSSTTSPLPSSSALWDPVELFRITKAIGHYLIGVDPDNCSMLSVFQHLHDLGLTPRSLQPWMKKCIRTTVKQMMADLAGAPAGMDDSASVASSPVISAQPAPASAAPPARQPAAVAASAAVTEALQAFSPPACAKEEPSSPYPVSSAPPALGPAARVNGHAEGGRRAVAEAEARVAASAQPAEQHPPNTAAVSIAAAVPASASIDAAPVVSVVHSPFVVPLTPQLPANGGLKRKRERPQSEEEQTRVRSGHHDTPIVVSDSDDDSDTASVSSRSSSSSSRTSSSAASQSSSASSARPPRQGPPKAKASAAKGKRGAGSGSGGGKKLMKKEHRRREANQPVGHDESGNDVWEVKEVLRCDVNEEGVKVYKCSWWNWTGWPRYTWITRDEWMGDEADLQRAEEAERRRATPEKRKRGSGKRKVATSAIDARSSYAHDKKVTDAWTEKWARKEAKEKEAKARKAAQHSATAKDRKGTPQAKTAKHKAVNGHGKAVRVKKEGEGEDAVGEGDESMEVVETAEQRMERRERKKEEAKKRRDEKRRLQEEENGRVVPQVRADSRFLIPWSSDDEEEDEGRPPSPGAPSEAAAQQRQLRNERRQRRRQLRIHALSEFKEGRSKARPMQEYSDGAEHSGASASEESDPGVKVHDCELTGTDSEAEMAQWRQPRRYRVDRLVDHRQVGSAEGQKELEERARQEEKGRKSEADRRERQRPASQSARSSAFERAQRAIDDEMLLDHGREEGEEGVDGEAVVDGGTREGEAAEWVEEQKDGGAEKENGGFGALQYRVKWTAHGEKAQTWEGEEHMAGCEALLKAYQMQQGLTSKARAARRSSRR